MAKSVNKAREHLKMQFLITMIAFTLMGLLIFIYSLVNLVNNKLIALSVIGLIIGLIVFIHGLFAVKRNYKKM